MTASATKKKQPSQHARAASTTDAAVLTTAPLPASPKAKAKAKAGRAAPLAADHKQAALLDELVPPSDYSSSPPSPSPHSPPPARAAEPLPAAVLTAVAAESDRPRLKVVIPPVPPFLHEVDKRNERERAALLKRLRDDRGASSEAAAQQAAGDDDSDFHTPEKQQQTYQQSAKHKLLGSELDGPEQVLLFHESEYRMSQITPPPSDRMLDHKNPPLPPRKTKKRRRIERPVNPITGRMTFSALPLPPRLSLSSETSTTSSGFSMPSPPMLDTPPGSPVRMSSVFRSLADEFAAVQDTPPLRTLRPPPRITRAARQCTPPISSRTRSAIQTPTTTMVLRSRQLNPSKTA